MEPGVIGGGCVAERNIEHGLAKVDAVERGVRRVADSRIGFDIRGCAGRGFVEVIEEQRAVPLEMLADAAEMIDDNRVVTRLPRDGRAADAAKPQFVHVDGDELALVENGTGDCLVTDSGPLQNQWRSITPRAALLELTERGLQFVLIVDEFHALAGGAGVEFQKAWEVGPTIELSPTRDDGRLGMRQLQILEQREKVQFAKQLRNALERRHGNRHALGECVADTRQEINLFMRREEDVVIGRSLVARSGTKDTRMDRSQTMGSDTTSARTARSDIGRGLTDQGCRSCVAGRAHRGPAAPRGSSPRSSKS